MQISYTEFRPNMKFGYKSIFTKLNIARRNYVEKFYTLFHSNIELSGRNTFTPLSMTLTAPICMKIALVRHVVKNSCTEPDSATTVGEICERDIIYASFNDAIRLSAASDVNVKQ